MDTYLYAFNYTKPVWLGMVKQCLFISTNRLCVFVQVSSFTSCWWVTPLSGMRTSTNSISRSKLERMTWVRPPSLFSAFSFSSFLSFFLSFCVSFFHSFFPFFFSLILSLFQSIIFSFSFFSLFVSSSFSFLPCSFFLSVFLSFFLSFFLIFVLSSLSFFFSSLPSAVPPLFSSSAFISCLFCSSPLLWLGSTIFGGSFCFSLDFEDGAYATKWFHCGFLGGGPALRLLCSANTK